MEPVSDPDSLVDSLDEFMRSFSYPAAQGLLVADLAHHSVHSRADRGNAAAYFAFPEMKTMESHVSEIPPAGATKTHRHSCEALFYVLSGEGYSLLWDDGQEPRRVSWKAGDLFCTPIHLWHRHVNIDATHPARYLEITTIPLMKSVGNWTIEASEEEPPDDATPAQ